MRRWDTALTRHLVVRWVAMDNQHRSAVTDEETGGAVIKLEPNAVKVEALTCGGK